MKTIKEQYKEIVCGWNEERTENVANRCTEIAEEFSICFLNWITKNGYEEYWNTETPWVSIIEVLDVGEENAKCYTIKELLEIYKKTL